MKLSSQALLALAAGATVRAQSLTDALGSQNASLSTLYALLSQNRQLLDTLNNLQNATFLAPNNDALDPLVNNQGFSSQLASPGYLEALLSYHTLNGSYRVSDFGNSSMFIPTMLTSANYTNVTGGQRLEAKRIDDHVTFFDAFLQNASIVAPDVNFTGGTVQIIDRLMTIPPNLTSTLTNSNLTATAGALRAANLTDAADGLRDVTVFAPDNAAFAAIGSIVGHLTPQQLSRIAGYHVVNGSVVYANATTGNQTLRALNGMDLTVTVVNGTVFANDARVTVPNILCANGVVHVVNQVLNPDNAAARPNPTQTSATAAFSGASSDSAGVPFTSGQPTATTTYPAATSGGGDTGPGGAAGEGGAETTTKSGPAMPIRTGAVGAAALFGGAALVVNW
ncbi:FAS1 domain-containing protein [Xylariomycetidae sp. FL0641]|nr:FAS1 domain-containing protein [Xylariomycetidae sp. FL0641]